MSSEPRTGVSPPLGPTDMRRGTARYLLAIANLSESDSGRVTTGGLHERLDVAQPSVSEMVSKLDERGLVDYKKYEGVTLTDQGEELAMRVGKRFCVVSTFFESVLDTTIDDETALDIGFVLSEDGIFRLRELVGSACLRLCPESSSQ